jgi:hypothetical protein
MILSGWKDIANYLRCGVRTVQRWEADGLPVHRPTPGRRSHVIAYSEEIDGWVRGQGLPKPEYAHLAASIPNARRLQDETHMMVLELQKPVTRLRN